MSWDDDDELAQRVSEAVNSAESIVEDEVELTTTGCRCRFTGSLADQVFTCMSCGAFPEECSDGECGCLVA
jgi:hypothetical protein